MKAKDKSAALTPDLFSQKRRGRPPRPDALTNAQRQAKYRKNRVALEVGARMTATVASLAEQFEITPSEVTAYLVRYALCNKNWKKTGFPTATNSELEAS